MDSLLCDSDFCVNFLGTDQFVILGLETNRSLGSLGRQKHSLLCLPLLQQPIADYTVCVIPDHKLHRSLVILAFDQYLEQS